MKDPLFNYSHILWIMQQCLSAISNYTAALSSSAHHALTWLADHLISPLLVASLTCVEKTDNQENQNAEKVKKVEGMSIFHRTMYELQFWHNISVRKASSRKHILSHSSNTQFIYRLTK